MFRGRLIFPFLVELAQLDLTETESGSSKGFDDDFKETKIVQTSDRLGSSTRSESTLIKLPGQFGNPQSMAVLMEVQTGNISPVEFEILFHFRDLEANSLIEASTGSAKIKVGDRLNAIYRMNGDLVQKIRNPPGAFITKAMPTFGLHGARNLLVCTFKSRDQGQS